MGRLSSFNLNRFRSGFPWPLGFLFYAGILWIIAGAKFPAVNPAAPVVRKLIFSGNERFLPAAPGAEFSVFRPYLPKSGFVSFIKDSPHQPTDLKTEWLCAAQSQLFPLILNKNPGEKTALIFCSNAKIAEVRMRETGYHMTKPLGDGKGIAERNS